VKVKVRWAHEGCIHERSCEIATSDELSKHAAKLDQTESEKPMVWFKVTATEMLGVEAAEILSISLEEPNPIIRSKRAR